MAAAAAATASLGAAVQEERRKKKEKRISAPAKAKLRTCKLKMTQMGER